MSSVLTLLTIRDDSKVSFVGGGSSFNALSVQADNGIQLEQDITTRVGTLSLDGDYEDSSTGDSLAFIEFIDGSQIRAKTVMTLENTSGTIKADGTISLLAGSGIQILNNFGNKKAGSSLLLNADYESEGDGTLTVAVGSIVDSNNASVMITTWDCDLQGSLTAGDKQVSIHAAAPGQLIGLGNTAKDLHLSDAEMGSLSCDGITIGSNSSGTIYVHGLHDSSTDTIGRLTLQATNAERQIIFQSGATSFNKGVTLQAMAGIILSESVTTKSLGTILQTGTGSLTVALAKSLSTTSQHLLVTANDVDFWGTVTSGNATTAFGPYSRCTTGTRWIQMGRG